MAERKIPVKLPCFAGNWANLKFLIGQTPQGRNFAVIPCRKYLVCALDIFIPKHRLNDGDSFTLQNRDDPLFCNAIQESTIWCRSEYLAFGHDEEIRSRKLSYISEWIENDRIIESGRSRKP